MMSRDHSTTGGGQYQCLLHVGTQGDDTVHLFSNGTWATVQHCTDSRKRTLSTASKYATICDILPLTYGPLDGYHKSCYKNFTAIPKHPQNSQQQENYTSSEFPLLRSSLPPVPTSSSGVHKEDFCIFCPVLRKSVKSSRGGNVREGLSSCETPGAGERIIEAAKILNNERVLAKFSYTDFVSKKVKYHSSCRKAFLADAQRVISSRSTGTGKSKLTDAHSKAFPLIQCRVDNIIKDRGGIILKELHKLYIDSLVENGVLDSGYSAQSLEKKICNDYADRVKVEKISNKVGKVLFCPQIGVNEAFAYAQQNQSQIMVEEAALLIRSEILKLTTASESLPYPLTASDIAKGEAKILHILTIFYSSLHRIYFGITYQ